jgi:hypothetical protein
MRTVLSDWSSVELDVHYQAIYSLFNILSLEAPTRICLSSITPRNSNNMETFKDVCCRDDTVSFILCTVHQTDPNCVSLNLDDLLAARIIVTDLLRRERD